MVLNYFMKGMVGNLFESFSSFLIVRIILESNTSYFALPFRSFPHWLFRSFSTSALSHYPFVVSQSRCFRSLVVLHHPFVVLYRPFVVLQSWYFALSLFRTFVVSYFRCFVH